MYLKVVAASLPDEQIHGIKEMFNTWDTDKNGSLTPEELKLGLMNNDKNVSDPDVQLFMDAVSQRVYNFTLSDSIILVTQGDNEM